MGLIFMVFVIGKISAGSRATFNSGVYRKAERGSTEWFGI
jgi:hypothetical protein